MFRTTVFALYAIAVQCLSSTMSMADEAQTAIPLISVEPFENGLLIKGSVLALEPGDFTTRLEISKQGSGGSTKTSQGHKSSMLAGELTSVASVSLTMHADDFLSVNLILLSDSKEIGSNTLVLGNTSLSPD